MLDQLLNLGYLPAELPPPFNSRFLAGAINCNGQIHQACSSVQAHSVPAVHNLGRTGSLRRKLSIPNPIHHFHVCKEVADNWAPLMAHCSASGLSKSKPFAGSVRAISRSTPMADLVTHRTAIRAGKRYILQTDISTFYQSIYAHSIPWAIHSKPFAKTNRGRAHYGNRLDTCIRNAQDQQTMGIPIGPDTSFVIAESILSAADVALLSGHRTVKGFRYVDDYEFAFNTFSEAESCLAGLQESLSQFELNLNPRKTCIKELPQPSESPWVTELRRHSFSNRSRSQRYNIIEYFDRSFDLFRQYPDEYVLKYAIARLGQLSLWPSAWDLAFPYLCQAMSVDSGCIPIALALIKQHATGSHQVLLPTLEATLNDVVRRHLPMGHHSEVSWSLWGCIEFGLGIDQDVAQQCIDYGDAVIHILLSDAQIRSQIPTGAKLNWQPIVQSINSAALYDSNWLAAYELDHKNWFQTNGSAINSCPAFSHLHNNGVSFYDPSATMQITPLPLLATSVSGAGSMVSGL